MAPKLDDRTREQIALMITMPNLSNTDIARIANVHARTVTRHRENMEKYGKTVIREYERHNPTIKLLPKHQEDAIKYMNEHPEAQLNEVADFLKEKYSISVTRSTISRMLKKMGWKTKRALIKAQRLKEQEQTEEERKHAQDKRRRDEEDERERQLQEARRQAEEDERALQEQLLNEGGGA